MNATHMTAHPTPETIIVILNEGKAITENSETAKRLYEEGAYGTPLADGRIALGTLEHAYLSEKKRVTTLNNKGKKISHEKILQKAKKQIKNFETKYAVFKDIRNRGYAAKTALKFGAEFRVYDRGIKPGQDHAKWIVYSVKEHDTLTWHEFSAKNRVAHSTKKRLLVGVVDDEGDVSYWEVRWFRP